MEIINKFLNSIPAILPLPSATLPLPLLKILPLPLPLFTSKGRLILGGSVERQFYPAVYISRALTAVRSPSPSVP